MQLVEPTYLPPAVCRLAPSLESCAIQEETQHGEQEQDQTLSDSLLSEDIISFTHQQDNSMQLSNPILVITYVPCSGWISTLMTKSQMQQLKPHLKTQTTGKRACMCAHCGHSGHTKPTCPILLSGNQCIQPAKSIDPGRYI